MRGQVVVGNPELVQAAAHHDFGSELSQGASRCLRYERYCARSPRVYLEYVDNVVLDGELHVHQSNDTQLQCERFCLLLDGSNDLCWQRVWRQHARRIPRVDTGLLDVLHDAANYGFAPVAHQIHVDLDCSIEEL